ncbi:MAG TPA: hypothetical protein VNR20_03260 [Terriglobales bacterium]|nr:hypothetical protein [Terriglobales bacterium]
MTDKKRPYLCHGEEFEHRGYTFRVRFERDDFMNEPWKECDGHGVVSDWTSDGPRKGQRVLRQDRFSCRYYDFHESLKIAIRDGWRAPDEPDPTKAEAVIEGMGGNRREIIRRAKRAVEADFEYLWAWCNDRWEYLVVFVDWADDLDVSTNISGVESYKDYHQEVVWELADELMSQIEVDEPDIVLSEN